MTDRTYDAPRDDPRAWPLDETVLSNGWLSHVCCDGARFHVLSYGGYTSHKTHETICIDWCSEPFCDLNRRSVLRCFEHGLDPVRCCAIPRLKDWLSNPRHIPGGCRE